MEMTLDIEAKNWNGTKWITEKIYNFLLKFGKISIKNEQFGNKICPFNDLGLFLSINSTISNTEFHTIHLILRFWYMMLVKHLSKINKILIKQFISWSATCFEYNASHIHRKKYIIFSLKNDVLLRFFLKICRTVQ